MEPYEKVLEQFLKNSMKQFGVRELSSITNLDTKTILKYLKRLISEGLVSKKSPKKKYPYYEATRTSYEYKHEKSEKVVRELLKSKLVKYFEEKMHPKAIVLFGSIQKGTYTDNSDIDIFIQGKEKAVDVSVFEKKFKREIHIIMSESVASLSKGLQTNIINGITLSGSLEL